MLRGNLKKLDNKKYNEKQKNENFKITNKFK
jgi:hypothetical protein